MPLKLLDRSVALWQNGSAVGIPRRHGWKTPPGPRGSNGIQSMLVGCGLGGFLSCGGRLCRVSAAPVGYNLGRFCASRRAAAHAVCPSAARPRCRRARAPRQVPILLGCLFAAALSAALKLRLPPQLARGGRAKAGLAREQQNSRQARGGLAGRGCSGKLNSLSPYFSSMTSSSEMAP